MRTRQGTRHQRWELEHAELPQWNAIDGPTENNDGQERNHLVGIRDTRGNHPHDRAYHEQPANVLFDREEADEGVQPEMSLNSARWRTEEVGMTGQLRLGPRDGLPRIQCSLEE